MTILSEIATNILTKLEQEAGTNEWWTDTEIKSWFNEIYSDVLQEGGYSKTRNTNTKSVAEQSYYVFPLEETSGAITTYEDDLLQVLGVTYDNEPIYPTTIEELNVYSRTWRDQSSDTPIWYYFEKGYEFERLNLFPKPDTSDIKIGITFTYVPHDISDGGEPIMPFKNGRLIGDAVMSLALAKEGEGQNIERSEWYWNMFSSKLHSLTRRSKMPERVHRLRSIEDGSVQGLNLGDHYPSYPRS